MFVLCVCVMYCFHSLWLRSFQPRFQRSGAMAAPPQDEPPRPVPRNTVTIPLEKFFEKKLPKELWWRIVDFVPLRDTEPCGRLQIMLANSRALNQAIFAQLVQRTRELQETRDLVDDIDFIIQRARNQLNLGVPVDMHTFEFLMDMINYFQR